CDRPALYRLLRFLLTEDVLREDENGRFSLTALGRTLRSGPMSVIRDVVTLLGSPFYSATVADLPHTVRTGQNAFEHVHGQGFFSYLAGHPMDSAVFNAAMGSTSALRSTAI